MMGRLHVFPNPAAVATAAATEFFRLASDVLHRRDVFRAVLAGGATPRIAYERIAEMWRGGRDGNVAWERVHLYWGDERMVPADDPRSNYGMARAALISRVPIPPENVHPIVADDANTQGAASRYEAEVRESFGLDAGDLPRFDLVFLGMGADGHTASLFPGAAALEESTRVAVAARHPESGEPRVTLTLPVLNEAAAPLVLVTGREKAERLRQVFGRKTPSPAHARLPIERLTPKAGTLRWFVSRDAAPWATAQAIEPGTEPGGAG